MSVAADALGRTLYEAAEDLDGPILVLGTEEFQYTPLRAALRLRELRQYGDVLYASTTRSPILTLPRPGYAVQSSIAFRPHDGVATEATRFAYNIAGPEQFGAIVVFTDSTADPMELNGPEGLVRAVGSLTQHLMLAQFD